MPGYYNPYTLYPVGYANQMGYTNNMQMQQPVQQSYSGETTAMMDADLLMKWVEGEVGAKAFQMPKGWPANKPIPLWDTTDTIIWVKSWGPMGIPNPMQKLKYEMENTQQQMLMAGNAGVSGNAATEASEGQFVTKDDLESMKREIMEAVKAGHSGNAAVNVQNPGNNQNGNGRNGNRGGNQ